MSALFPCSISRKYTPQFSQLARDRQTYEEAMSMISGKPGGAFSMNLWAEAELFTQDFHQEGVYTVNPNLWCPPALLQQLSCCVIAKNDGGTCYNALGVPNWRTQYGGVAITPWHIAYCAHAYSHAQGTWSQNPGALNPTIVRLRGMDGVLVDRTQVHQADAKNAPFNAASDYGANIADVCVAVLDEPLPSTIFIPRIISPMLFNRWFADFLTTRRYARIALSQEWIYSANPSYQPGFPTGSDYPQHNRQMVHIHGLADPGSEMVNFRYNVWPGDRGTPGFTVKNGELVFSHLVGADDFEAYPYGGWTAEQRLNTLIQVANAKAVALGRLEAGQADCTVTSYTH